MPVRRLLCSLFVSLLSIPILAATLTIGNSNVAPNSSDTNAGSVRTDIDLTNPASHTGTVTSVTVKWSASCANTMKVKFFRRVGDSLSLVAERGPFTIAASNNYTLTPAVSVQQGDLIGVVSLGVCGNPVTLVAAFVSEGYLQFAGDLTGTVPMASGTRQNGILAAGGTGSSTEVLASVIPVVGSAAGAFGAQFRTEMQFFNPEFSGEMSVKLVYHRSGTPGSSADPTRPVTIPARRVITFDDIIVTMGGTGVGSLDVIVANDGPVPIIITRIYNDAGALGTSGLSEDPIIFSSADYVGRGGVLHGGVTGFLVAPRMPSKTRFNIGVRTLHSGATITFTARNPSGVVVATFTKTYTATYFEQVDVNALLGTTLTGNESIEVSVSSGDAIVYGSTTDNITNDPAIQIVKGVFAVA